MKMIDIFIFAINAVTPIIIMIGLGYCLKQRGLFTQEFLKVGNKTVFQLLLPVLLFTNLTQMDSDGQLAGQLVVWTTLLSSVVIFLSIVLLRGIGLL